MRIGYLPFLDEMGETVHFWRVVHYPNKELQLGFAIVFVMAIPRQKQIDKAPHGIKANKVA
jgi:hypothetical protein